MPKLTIDNQVIEIAQGATILDAARKAGIAIPTLCYLDNGHCPTSCFVCVVKVNGAERLLPACATKVTDGMVVESETIEVRGARKMALELLFSDHLGDCQAPCQTVCPAHLDIPTMLRQIASSQLREAIVTVKASIPLPATLGRICPNLCERGCRRAQHDSAVSICLAKRFVGDTDLASADPYLPACLPATGKQVAIIGAGPAGLSAAWYLQQAGHACSIFDEHEEPGGMVRYGVPAAVLPRKVLDAEIALITRLGVVFRPQTRIGREISLAELQQSFDAVLIACGENNLPDLMMNPKTEKTAATKLPGVFIAGGAASSVRHAVRAVADGHAAALSIMQYLSGQPVTGTPNPFSIHISRLQPDELAHFLQHATPDARIAPTVKGFTPAEAAREARRCLHCDCRKLQTCKLRQYAEDYLVNANRFKGERRRYEEDNTHPGVIYEPGKCIDCGLCIAIASEARERLGLTFIGRGFAVRMAVPFDETLAAGLEHIARACVDACPTGALALKDAADEDH